MCGVCACVYMHVTPRHGVPWDSQETAHPSTWRRPQAPHASVIWRLYLAAIAFPSFPALSLLSATQELQGEAPRAKPVTEKSALRPAEKPARAPGCHALCCPGQVPPCGPAAGDLHHVWHEAASAASTRDSANHGAHVYREGG